MQSISHANFWTLGSLSDRTSLQYPAGETAFEDVFFDIKNKINFDYFSGKFKTISLPVLFEITSLGTVLFISRAKSIPGSQLK